MTTTVTWPTALPKPTIPGYGIDDTPPIIRSDMDQGAARQRRRFTSAQSEYPVSWELSAWQFMIFDGFEEHEARFGAEWFTIELLGATGMADHEARFKGKTRKEFRGNERWHVSGILEIRERPKLSADELELLKTQDPDVLEAALISIHETVLSIGASP